MRKHLVTVVRKNLLSQEETSGRTTLGEGQLSAVSGWEWGEEKKTLSASWESTTLSVLLLQHLGLTEGFLAVF